MAANDPGHKNQVILMAFFFVGGSQRSGTTLLATVLCSGQETNDYLGESPGLRSLLESYRNMRGRFESEGRFHFATQPVMDEYFSGIVRSFLSHTLATQAPATSLVLKEPHLTQLFPLLHKLIPQSRFILIKRDPRDIVVSMLKVGERMAEDGKEHLFNSGNIARISASILPFYAPTINTAQRNSVFRRACHWVEYEALTQQPADMVEKLRKFTGLKLEGYDAENPTQHVNKEKRELRTKDPRTKPWVTDLMDKGSISAVNVGRFKEYLSDEQIAIVENTLGELMNVLGYELISK